MGDDAVGLGMLRADRGDPNREQPSDQGAAPHPQAMLCLIPVANWADPAALRMGMKTTRHHSTPQTHGIGEQRKKSPQQVLTSPSRALPSSSPPPKKKRKKIWDPSAAQEPMQAGITPLQRV